MIDLMELVVRAANKGIRLFVAFESPMVAIVKARRGNLSVDMTVETHTLRIRNWEQGDYANYLLDGIIHKLDEAEEKGIREGDLRVIGQR